MNDTLAERIIQCPTLPSLPAIAMQVVDLAQRADADVAHIAKVIGTDPALAGKILRTVNSSFYARSQPVGTVTQAVVILGLQSVKTLVLGFSLVANLSGGKSGGKGAAGAGFDHLGYWRRSIYAATAARTLAAKVGILQQEEAFLAALLADVGMLVLDRVLGDEYAKATAGATTHDDWCAAEQAALGMTHAEAGGLLAAAWKLPPLLATPVAKHHAPADVPEPQLRKLTELVYLAGRCADVYVDQQAAGAIAAVRKLCQDQHGLTEADADAVLADIGARTTEAAKLFEISLGPPAVYDAILKKANDALVDLTLQTQAQATALQQKATDLAQKASDLAVQNERLRVQATTDGLTALANRARFDQFLAEQFNVACEQGKPLSLLILDVDKFKQVNDRYGHPAGDKVIQAVAKVMATAARSQDLAARFGGEEMALVLPGTARATAAAIAESVRRTIAAKPVQTDVGPVSVTASLGVATCEPGGPLKAPAHLMKAADLAVYAAKNAGRNAVRVFTLAAAAKPAA